MAGRRLATLKETADAQMANRDDVLLVPTDVSAPDSVAELFDRARERFLRIDVLFNNAGVFGSAAPVEDVRLQDWNDVVAVNLTGAFLCAQAAYIAMRDQVPSGGRIINNGSLSAHVPRPNAIAYTATKHAITGLTKAISLEGRRYGIACGQIDVGNAATELTTHFADCALQADGSLVGEPLVLSEDVAAAVVYMASLPLDTNVQFLTIMATTMPSFIGRG